LALHASSSVAFEFLAQVEKSYSGLIGSTLADRDIGLGGKLLYAGKLDDDARALIVAANIAGATSLTASADPEVQKQALRDGTVDFLVGSLDEALRILKNQLRKREPVAVCVALAPEVIEQEMRERGVLPDLVETDLPMKVEEASAPKETATVVWSVASAPAQWLPKLDATALDCLDPNAARARRWLRLAPRYLGRTAQSIRLLRCDSAFTTRFTERVRGQVERGEIGTAVEMQIRDADGTTRHLGFEPESRGT